MIRACAFIAGGLLLTAACSDSVTAPAAPTTPPAVGRQPAVAHAGIAGVFTGAEADSILLAFADRLELSGRTGDAAQVRSWVGGPKPAPGEGPAAAQASDDLLPTIHRAETRVIVNGSEAQVQATTEYTGDRASHAHSISITDRTGEYVVPTPPIPPMEGAGAQISGWRMVFNTTVPVSLPRACGFSISASTFHRVWFTLPASLGFPGEDTKVSFGSGASPDCDAPPDCYDDRPDDGDGGGGGDYVAPLGSAPLPDCYSEGETGGGEGGGDSGSGYGAITVEVCHYVAHFLNIGGTWYLTDIEFLGCDTYTFIVNQM